MIQSTILLMKAVVTEKFPNAIPYLKRKAGVYKPKKSNTLSKKQIRNSKCMQMPRTSFAHNVLCGRFGETVRYNVKERLVPNTSREYGKFLFFWTS